MVMQVSSVQDLQVIRQKIELSATSGDCDDSNAKSKPGAPDSVCMDRQ